MLLTLSLFFVLDKFLFANCDLLFKNRYEQKNQEFFRKSPLSPSVKEDFFEQKLDHFNPTDTRTWKQVPTPYSQFYTLVPKRAKSQVFPFKIIIFRNLNFSLSSIINFNLALLNLMFRIIHILFWKNCFYFIRGEGMTKKYILSELLACIFTGL